MTTSHIAAGIANVRSRLFSLALLTALALGVPSLSAQQPRLVGTWSGVDHGANLTLVMRPNGRYSRTAKSGTSTAQQSGGYTLAAQNRIVFAAAHTPSEALQASQAAPGPPMPLASRSSVVFQGPNRIVVTDETTHRSVTMVRVR